jgi:hypothetical protein
MSRPLLNRLVFAGEAIVDLLMWVPALPERGGDMLADAAAIEVGGGFNVMAAAVRQGLPVVYAGGHGTGPWGDKVRAALAAEGIRFSARPTDADTGVRRGPGRGGRRADVRHCARRGSRGRAGPGTWSGPARRRGLRVRLWPGPGRVGPGSRAWAAGLPPGVLLFVDPGHWSPTSRRCSTRCWPARLVELQPARGRPAHRQRRPGQAAAAWSAGPGPMSSSGPDRTAA